MSADEFEITRPLACPLRLRGGLLGWLTGYPHEGRTWTPDWDRGAVLEPSAYSRARYHPAALDGYTAEKGWYIEAWYWGAARWYDPHIDVRCTQTTQYFQGRIVGTRDSYKVYGHGGTVEDCDRGEAVMPAEESYFGSDYDPYSPGAVVAPGSGTCSGSGEGGGGGGDGNGNDEEDPTIQPWPGDAGGGARSICPDSMPVYYDLACIEIFVEGDGWQIVWCGVVRFCG